MGHRSVGRPVHVRVLSVLMALVGGAGVVAALVADEPRPGTLSAADGATSTTGSSTTTSAAPPEAAPTSEVPPAPAPAGDPAPPATPPTTVATTPATRPAAPARERRIYCVSHRGLESMRRDGADRRVVAPDALRDLDVAPDGSWLVATIWSQRGLYRVELPGGAVSKISDDLWQSARISPDGQRIAGVRMRMNPQVVIIDTTGSALTEFEYLNPNASSLDWTWDGQGLAYTSGAGNAVAIFDLENPAEVRYLQIYPAGLIGEPALSPAGHRVAVSNGGDVFVAPSGGGPHVEVTRDAPYRASQPVWEDEDTLLISYDMGVARVGADGTRFEIVTGGCTNPTVQP